MILGGTFSPSIERLAHKVPPLQRCFPGSMTQRFHRHSDTGAHRGRSSQRRLKHWTMLWSQSASRSWTPLVETGDNIHTLSVHYYQMTPNGSPNPRSEARTSNSSTFLDEREFMFLANRSEKVAPPAPNFFVKIAREVWGALISDTLTLLTDLGLALWRWVRSLGGRSRTCVISVFGLLGGLI